MNAINIQELEDAIARSEERSEIVEVTVKAADISDVLSEINAIYDGEVDDARLEPGVYDVWGWQEGSADMDWRLTITIES